MLDSGESSYKGVIDHRASGVSLAAKKIRFGPALLLVALAAAALLIPLPNDYRASWFAKATDLAHVPLMAVLVFGLWRFAGISPRAALALVLVLTVVAELAQIPLARDAQLGDMARGALGGLLGVVCIQLAAAPITSRRAIPALAAAAVLVAWPIVDATPTLWDAWSAYREFPVLCNFADRWEARRWSPYGAQVERVAIESSPATWAGEVRFRTGNPDWAGAVMFPVVRDWRGYRRLVCEFTVSGEPFPLLFSVRDGSKAVAPAKRFDLRKTFAAGDHRLVIDLQALAEGEEFSPVDLATVQSLHIYATDLKQPHTLLLRRIYLE